MKPMIIIPPETMSKEDMDRLRENGICVVEAKEPARVKFVDPLPVVTSRTEIEAAAIKLCRRVINPGFWSSDDTRKLMAANFIDILAKGTPLSNEPTQEEKEKDAYNFERIDEMRRLARADAKAERDAEKARLKAEKEAKEKKASISYDEKKKQLGIGEKT